MAVQWPLVGRDGEIERCTLLLDDGPGVVISGPPGVGKTRLARELAGRAERAGACTVRLLATRASAALPFGVLAPWLPVDPGAGAADLLARLRAALVTLAGDRRLVLLIDDAHLLDDGSAALVEQLTATGQARPVVAVRTGEPVPDPVLALWKDHGAERIELGPLTAVAVAALVDAALGAPVDPDTVRRLIALCAGNVLYLRELVLGALDEQRLVMDGGRWQLRGAPVVSPRLVELVRARLGDLDDQERAILELLAYGEPLGLDVLTAKAGPELLDRLEARGLLAAVRDWHRTDVRLAHPLYGEVLRAQTAPLRARRLLATLADTLTAYGARRRDDLLRVASWRLDAGGPTEAGPMLEAARAARARWDVPLATRLAQAAVDAGGGFDAALFAGQLMVLGGDATGAEATFAGLADAAADDAARVALASSRIDNLVYGLGRPLEATEVCVATRARVTDRAGSDELSALLANAQLYSGRTADALGLVEPLLPALRDRAFVAACVTAQTCLGLVGRLDEAIEVGRRGLAANRVLPPAATRTFGSYVHVSLHGAALIYAGRFAEADGLLVAAHREARGAGAVEAAASMAMMRARLLLTRGCADAALKLVDESLATYRRHGWHSFLRVALARRARALALRGRAEAARAALAELADAERSGTSEFYAAEIRESRAWTEVAAGDLPAARSLLGEAAALARDSGDAVLEAAALHDLARLGEARAVTDRLDALAQRIDGVLVPARAAHARALAGADVGALARVALDFEAMGAWLFAAEAAGAQARLLRRAGNARAATGAIRRSVTLAARCAGVRLPTLVTGEVPAQLTARERDVAAMAAGGMSNRDIAGRASVSVRTVENQLARVYEKLGVSGRRDLAAALAGPVDSPVHGGVDK